MEKIIKLKIERFEENGEVYYLATSEDVQGLVAQGDTVEEAVEIAEDLAKILLELKAERAKNSPPTDKSYVIERSLVVSFNG